MCEERENLVAYLYDEVDANERKSVEKHLSSCETCREELRAFRDVRQDLLAWDVPAHESVWKPFVTARTQPVWRQMPAWAMAAAAMLVFAIGGAGGFAGRALASRAEADVPSARAAVQAPAEPASVTPAATRDELRALQARLADVERAASARTVPTASAPTVSEAAMIAKVEQLIRESEGRVSAKTSQRIWNMVTDLNAQRNADLARVTQQISDAQERTNGNILAVKNMRSEKEKE